MDAMVRHALSELTHPAAPAAKNQATCDSFLKLLAADPSPRGTPASDRAWQSRLRTACAFLDPSDKTSFDEAARRLAEAAPRPTPEGAMSAEAVVRPGSQAALDQLFGSAAEREAALLETLPQWLTKSAVQERQAAGAAATTADEILESLVGAKGERNGPLWNEARKLIQAHLTPGAPELPPGRDWLGAHGPMSERKKIVRAYAKFVATGGSNIALPEQILELVSSLPSLGKNAGQALKMVKELLAADDPKADSGRRLLTSDYRCKILTAVTAQLSDPAFHPSRQIQEDILDLVSDQAGHVPGRIHDGMSTEHKALVMGALVTGMPHLNKGLQAKAFSLVKDELLETNYHGWTFAQRASLAPLLDEHCRDVPGARAMVADFLKKSAKGGHDWERSVRGPLSSLSEQLLKSRFSKGEGLDAVGEAALRTWLKLTNTAWERCSVDEAGEKLTAVVGTLPGPRAVLADELVKVAQRLGGGDVPLQPALSFAVSRSLISLCKTDAGSLSAAQKEQAHRALAGVFRNLAAGAPRIPQQSLPELTKLMNELYGLQDWPRDEWEASLTTAFDALFRGTRDSFLLVSSMPDLLGIYPVLDGVTATAVATKLRGAAENLRFPAHSDGSQLPVNLIGNLSSDRHGDSKNLLKLTREIWDLLRPNHRHLALVELFNRFEKASPAGKHTVLEFVAGIPGADDDFTRAAVALAAQRLSTIKDPAELAFVHLPIPLQPTGGAA